MRRLRALGLIAALAMGAAVGAAMGAAMGAGAGAAQAASLSGLVLVASERMPDPRFQETVIYLIDHDESGAFGLVVNQPRGAGPIGALLDQLDIEHDDDEVRDGSITVHYGGPVEPDLGLVLHSADYAADKTRPVSDEIAFTASAEVLRDIARGEGPRRSLLLFGYCGWGPAQLENELARGDWAIVEADPDLVLGTDHETKWRRALGNGIVI